jgi:hypothetical protein
MVEQINIVDSDEDDQVFKQSPHHKRGGELSPDYSMASDRQPLRKTMPPMVQPF